MHYRHESLLCTQDITLLRGATNVIANISNVSLYTTEHLLILGPSGCGKTSLMNIMAGLSPPSTGDVVFKDISYRALSRSKLDDLRRKNFGFVFQRIHLISHLNVYQNIALSYLGSGKPIDHKRILDTLEKLSLTSKVTQKAEELSHGEAQRVAIARAVIHDPVIVFADEPTSALDDFSAQAVIDLLFNSAQNAGATLVVSTHDARIKGRFTNILDINK